jgi:uncharacterized repeat protein (TIGR03803 family)
MRNRYSSLRVLLTVFTCFSAVGMSGAQAPKFKVLHTFAGGSDGVAPQGPLVPDTAGNVYGVTVEGGSDTECSGGCGTVFELVPSGTRWKEKILFNFTGAPGNYVYPAGPLVVDAKGNLYGTTGQGGGQACNCGEVYELARSTNWTQSILYSFLGGAIDGAYPNFGLVADSAGNFFVETQQGGSDGYGTIVELTPGSGGSWTETIIYEFTNGRDGVNPYGGLTLDAAGNIYGIASGGGVYSGGTVFKLSPVSGGWAETTLYAFTGGENGYPTSGGVVLDGAGDLYGITTVGGYDLVGNVFRLSPAKGYWNYTTLHNFTGGSDGGYPYGRLAIDRAGNIYGMTSLGGSFEYGTIYKLISTNGVWKETVLHNFTNGLDGQNPYSGLTLDSSGNLYGAASGGADNFGLVFEITP